MHTCMRTDTRGRCEMANLILSAWLLNLVKVIEIPSNCIHIHDTFKLISSAGASNLDNFLVKEGSSYICVSMTHVPVESKAGLVGVDLVDLQVEAFRTNLTTTNFSNPGKTPYIYNNNVLGSIVVIFTQVGTLIHVAIKQF